MTNIKHFLWALYRSWAILLVTLILLTLLFLMSFRITSCSPDSIKNIFNVCVSLLCGVVVSLVTLVVNTYNSSINASKTINELVSNSCVELLDLYGSSAANDLPVELSKKYIEYHILYREICFISEPIVYTGNIKKLSAKYAQLVKQLKNLHSSSEFAEIEMIRNLAEELAARNYDDLH